MSPSRDAAAARFRRLVETIETDRPSVPVRVACPWVDGPAGASGGASASDGDDGGTTNEEAFRRLAGGTSVFPAPSMALEVLGTDERQAETTVEELRERRRKREGLTVRGDVVRRAARPLAGS